MSPSLAVQRPEISVLLSPSAFQQSISKTTAAASVVPPAPSEPSSTSVGAVEPPQAPCSKTQLQETLIHLIKVRQVHKMNKSSTVGTLEWKKSKLKLFTITLPLHFPNEKGRFTQITTKGKASKNVVFWFHLRAFLPQEHSQGTKNLLRNSQTKTAVVLSDS